MSRYRYDYVREHVDGFEYISRYVKLRRVGRVYKGLCPLHDERTPSFTVYPAGVNATNGSTPYVSFYCFGCKAGGDVIEFKRLIDHLGSRREALEALEREFEIKVDNDETHGLYLRERLETIRRQTGARTLSLAEINLTCSIVCRNYLLWVREYFPERYDDEVRAIDEYYAYLDMVLNEKSAMECMDLIDETWLRIDKRRERLAGLRDKNTMSTTHSDL